MGTGSPVTPPLQKFQGLYEPMMSACELCMRDNVLPSGEIIVKSSNDTRDYKVITLPNGMRAVLVSDLRHHHPCRDATSEKLSATASSPASRQQSATGASSDVQTVDDPARGARQSRSKQPKMSLQPGGREETTRSRSPSDSAQSRSRSSSQEHHSRGSSPKPSSRHGSSSQDRSPRASGSSQPRTSKKGERKHKVKRLNSESTFEADDFMEIDEVDERSSQESIPSTRSNTSILASVKSKSRKNTRPIRPPSDNEDYEDNLDEKDINKRKEDKTKSETEKLSAAALCVNVGSFLDPEDVPGLAHFLEHMLFMGSEKYPDENYFDAYLKNFGGASNAYTDLERTVFFFDVPRRQFKACLDIFAQFFICPLMKRKSFEREMNSVDSEFDISKQNDNNRKEQILGSMARPNHPMRKFFWGNIMSLKTNPEKRGIDVYSKLKQFYYTHYNARNMTLAVQSRESIETLEKYVRQIFGKIPNNSDAKPNFASMSEPFETPEFHMMHKIIPVSNRYQLDIIWPLPCLQEYYRDKPLLYIASWMGHEGEGSLLSYLRKNRYAVSIICGNGGSGFDSNSCWTAYVVTMTLTEAGMDNVYDVLLAMFEYLAMMRQHCPTRVFFDELQAIECNNFRFVEQGDAVDNVSALCVNMNLHLTMDIITGDCLYLKYNEPLIRRCMELITPRRCNICLMSKKFEGHCNLKEPWFNTAFSREAIPDKWYHAFEQVQPRHHIFHPPKFNTYIATDFTLLKTPKSAPTMPLMLRDSAQSRVWYKQDHRFCMPKAHCYYLLKSPLINQSPMSTALMDLYIAALKLNLTELTYPAIIAGLEFSIRSSEQALIIKCHGFSHKIAELVLTIINALVEFDLEEDLYEPLVAQQRQEYYNQYIKPESLAKEIRLSLILDRSWNSLDCQQALKLVTRPALVSFARDFTRHLFMESLIMGNISANQALELDEYIVKRLRYSPLESSLQPTNRVIQLPHAQTVCRIHNLNRVDNNSVIINYYQIGPYDLKEHAVCELLMSRMEEPCFDVLRTREQLGYSVSNTLRNTMGVLGYSITVCSQANKFSMDELDHKIEDFLEEFYDTVNRATENDFMTMKMSHIAIRSCEDTFLDEEVNRFWGEVLAGTYYFDRLEKTVTALHEVKLRDLKAWIKNHEMSAPKFRKLSIQITGNKFSGGETSAGTDSQHLALMNNPRFTFLPLKPKSKQQPITDFHAFKASRKLFAVTKAVDDTYDGGSVL